MEKQQQNFLPLEAQLLREAEAAALLRVSTSTLRTWRCLRKGPPYVRVGGRAIRYRAGDLLQWVAQGAQKGE